MSTINISVRTSKDTSRLMLSDRKTNFLALMVLLEGIRSGKVIGNVEVQPNTVAASGTITLASCATDTVTIGGVTFTGSGSPSGDAQFETDGNDTADAAALAAKINAHPTLSKVVSASSVLGVVTVTCLVKGVVGNFIPLSETGSTITVSGAFLTGGAQGTAEVLR